MRYPSLSDYQLAIQNPPVCLDDPDLKKGKPEKNPMGLPRAFSGGFALTYHIVSGKRDYAVRCFKSKVPGLDVKYKALTKELASRPSTVFQQFEYLTRGILVNGTWYPVVKMDWVKGDSLGLHIEKNLSNSSVLTSTADHFRAIVGELSLRGIAHGDLQHGNIMVRNGRLTLIDYDGMYIPAFRGQSSNEKGMLNYQHPEREAHFDETIDRFSSIVIYASLLALADDPSLWSRYNTGENLIFSVDDFQDPDNSPLLDHLRRRSSLADLSQRLHSVFAGSLVDVPTLEDWIGRRSVPVSTPKAKASRKKTIATNAASPYLVIAADDREVILRSEGDVVCVVGKVSDVRRDKTRFGKPYVFVNFGDYRKGCFTAVIWSSALENWTGLTLDDSLVGKTVQVTGLVQKYNKRQPESPQIVLDSGARIRLASGSLPSTPSPPRASTVRPAAPRSGSKAKGRNSSLVSQLGGSTSPATSAAPTAKPRLPAPARVTSSPAHVASPPPPPKPSQSTGQPTSNQALVAQLSGSSKSSATETTVRATTPSSPVASQPAAPSSSQSTSASQNASTDDGCCSWLVGGGLLFVVMQMMQHC